MNWFDWVLVAWIALGLLTSVSSVGKPRKPVTTGIATLAVLIDALLIVGVILWR